MRNGAGWRDDLLFTPGPLTTSPSVKQAMLRDLGARDEDFLGVVRSVRCRLLRLAGAEAGDHEAVLMQGCGSMGVEAALGTAVPRAGKLLVVANGAYGRRMADMAKAMDMEYANLEYPENTAADPRDVDSLLSRDQGVTHVAMVHCETTSGLFNPVAAVGKIVRDRGRSFIVDAMSSFGAAAIDLGEWHIDWLVSSANKCIEGVPGFSFVIVNRAALEKCAGNSRSVCLDLYAQSEAMRRDGQFRFTPPTHAILAFHQALLELEAEGGRTGRMIRYRESNAALRGEMRAMGFAEYLAEADRGWIISSYRYPAHPRFDFASFYRLLKDEGFVIYPGKIGDADVFRVGNIGRISVSDILALTAAMRRALQTLGVTGMAENALDRTA
ncbi:MAG: 2-aminoethylphosphonate--pyruvate transaminase [Planctomycetota bacterium]|jgi:2-aminoethylphosphonate-pyruvate transaminase|nr:2-aminoethylphosphonate--pyruvate transaminase [Planctomycetota bacterium]